MESWNQIQPIPMKYGQETRYVMKQSVWTHIIAEALSSQLHSRCVWSFKRNKVSAGDSAQYYCTIHAECVECGRIASGKINEVPKQDDDHVPVIFTFTGHEGIHKMKRPLAGFRRVKTQETNSEARSAAIIRHKMASEQMEYGDPEPPTIPSAHVIRQALYEKRVLSKLSSDYHEGIVMVKQKIPNYVRTIARDGFFVHFWTGQQEDLYKTYVSQRYNLEIDATGGVVLRAPNCDGSKSPVFYYVAVMNGIPVSQMLSANHDTPTITFWIDKWLKDVAKRPATVVVDHSLAMLNACSRAFNDMPLRALIRTLFQCANDMEMTPPPVYIRIDCAHTVKLLSKIPSLCSASRLVKRFYMNASCQLIMAASLKEASQLFKTISIAALSETTSSECRKAVNAIKTLIASGIADLEAFGIDDVEGNNADEAGTLAHAIDTQGNQFSEMAVKIISEAKVIAERDQSSEECDPNPFYRPQVPNALKAIIFDKLPLVTAIIAALYNTNVRRVSSCAVERHHGFIKNSVMGNLRLPVSPDVFLLAFHSYLDGMLKLQRASQDDRRKAAGKASTEDRGACDGGIQPRQAQDAGCSASNEPSNNTTISDVSHGPTMTGLPLTPSSQIGNPVVDDILITTSLNETCRVCQRPVGVAHQCSMCERYVHVFCGTSVGEEGYGQSVTCNYCYALKNDKHPEGLSTTSDISHGPTRTGLPLTRSTSPQTGNPVVADTQSRTSFDDTSTCRVCQRPVGVAHQCTICDQYIHVFCGISVGEEGYGQSVTCNCCYALKHDENTELSATENWMGEVSSSIPIKKRTYFDPNSDWGTGILEMKVLRNGNLMQPVHFPKKKAVSVRNTCSYDSIFSLFCGAYLDSLEFRQELQKQDENLFLSMVRSFCSTSNPAFVKAYKDRAFIIERKFTDLRRSSQDNKHMTFYDCK